MYSRDLERDDGADGQLEDRRQRAGEARGAGHQVPAGEFVHRVGERHAGQQHDERGDDHGIEVQRPDQARHRDGDDAGDDAGDRVARLVQPDAALRSEFEHADQQADQTGGSDVEPGQAQQARDGSGGEAETEDLHRALSSRRRLRERAKLRMSFGDADAAGHHVFGDAIGLA